MLHLSCSCIYSLLPLTQSQSKPTPKAALTWATFHARLQHYPKPINGHTQNIFDGPMTLPIQARGTKCVTNKLEITVDKSAQENVNTCKKIRLSLFVHQQIHYFELSLLRTVNRSGNTSVCIMVVRWLVLVGWINTATRRLVVVTRWLDNFN